MKLINKERRIKYLGFDDTWFIVIGIIILSFLSDYIFNNSFGRDLPIVEAIVSWAIALFFSILNWFLLREILIRLRTRFPRFKDNLKRNVLFLVFIISTVLIVDWVGTKFLSAVIGINFHELPRSKLVSIIIISIMTMAIYEAIYYYIRLKQTTIEKEQAKQAIIQAQFDTLRNQAQPHFLFNTLNTLRDIIDQNTKQEAKDFVDKIANVYRFILESSNENLIPLRDELKFAKSYMHIQSERFGTNLKVEWNINEDVLSRHIIPMSLQLLLENAIKHNVISRSKPLLIQVNATTEQLTVENKIQEKSSKLPSTQIGLKNIKKRYELISDRSIEIMGNGETFKVHLPLLNSPNKS